jgi:hypothetical protein
MSSGRSYSRSWQQCGSWKQVRQATKHMAQCCMTVPASAFQIGELVHLLLTHSPQCQVYTLEDKQFLLVCCRTELQSWSSSLTAEEVAAKVQQLQAQVGCTPLAPCLLPNPPSSMQSSSTTCHLLARRVAALQPCMPSWSMPVCRLVICCCNFTNTRTAACLQCLPPTAMLFFTGDLPQSNQDIHTDIHIQNTPSAAPRRPLPMPRSWTSCAAVQCW